MQSHALRRLAVAAGLAGALVVAAIAVSASSGTTKPSKPSAVPALFKGIPESDGVLGDPDASITVTEFVDLQCPVCAQASHDLMPTLIADYVRTGKVKLQARTLAFLGPDSERAARAAAGAAEQGHLWPFLHAFFSAQGAENSGYVTDGFLDEVAKASGVTNRDGGTSGIERATSEAQTYGVTGTPTFLVERADGAPEVVSAGELLAELGS